MLIQVHAKSAKGGGLSRISGLLLARGTTVVPTLDTAAPAARTAVAVGGTVVLKIGTTALILVTPVPPRGDRCSEFGDSGHGLLEQLS